MLMCEPEEPIGPNEWQYAVGEWNGHYEFSDFTDERLNRYSFVWFGEYSDANAALERGLHAVAAYHGGRATWFAAWRKRLYPGDFGTRARMAAIKRRKQGWTVYEDDILVVAGKEVGGAGEIVFSPPDFHVLPVGYVFLFLGDSPSPRTLAHPPVRPTVEWGGHSEQALAPNREFVSWLADNGYAAAYSARSHAGHPGFVVVTPKKLPLDELRARNLVTRVERAERAGSIWSHAPSWSPE